MAENKSIEVSDSALEDFNRFFSEWLDLNRDHLESAGTGDVLALMKLCAAWAQRHPH